MLGALHSSPPPSRGRGLHRRPRTRLQAYGMRLGLALLRRRRLVRGLRYLVVPVNYWRSLEYRLAVEESEFAGGDRVLDVGSPKLLSLWLAERLGVSVVATDIEPYFTAEYELLRGARHVPPDRLRVAVEDGRRLSFDDASFDKVYSLSVLEHIPDDGRTLVGFRRILARSGGRLILVVPAHQALYGAMDRLADHRRRYSGSGLRRLLETSGFRIIHARHFNPVGGLAWYANARLLPVRDLSAPVVNGQIRLFALVLPVARAVDWVACRTLRIPFGQSIIAVAEPCPG